MKEIAEGFIKVLLLIGFFACIGLGFGIGIVTAFKFGPPIHVEQKTTVRNAQ